MTECIASLEVDAVAGSHIVFPWSRLPELRAGDTLVDVSGPALQALSRHWLPGDATNPATFAWTFEALRSLQAGPLADLRITHDGYALAWITLSDKGARGEREDTAGPLVPVIAGQSLKLCLASGYLLSDDPGPLKALLAELALTQGFDLIVTSGGTGLAPRDLAPEATLAVIEKRLPGFERAMTMESLSKTPHGAISRAVAGTLGKAVLLNLPGSPKAVRECLGAVAPALRHALEKLQGDPSDCAAR
ncbi:MAG: MogA/MoaB family molybdenum cofactor biosynthesis protein [Desulfovibrionaceae bacterium]